MIILSEKRGELVQDELKGGQVGEFTFLASEERRTIYSIKQLKSSTFCSIISIDYHGIVGPNVHFYGQLEDPDQLVPNQLIVGRPAWMDGPKEDKHILIGQLLRFNLTDKL